MYKQTYIFMFSNFSICYLTAVVFFFFFLNFKSVSQCFSPLHVETDKVLTWESIRSKPSAAGQILLKFSLGKSHLTFPKHKSFPCKIKSAGGRKGSRGYVSATVFSERESRGSVPEPGWPRGRVPGPQRKQQLAKDLILVLLSEPDSHQSGMLLLLLERQRWTDSEPDREKHTEEKVRKNIQRKQEENDLTQRTFSAILVQSLATNPLSLGLYNYTPPLL